MDVLLFPTRLVATPSLTCGMHTTAGVAAHVWRPDAHPGDLCICGRRILPAKAQLEDDRECARADR